MPEILNLKCTPSKWFSFDKIFILVLIFVLDGASLTEDVRTVLNIFEMK